MMIHKRYPSLKKIPISPSSPVNPKKSELMRRLRQLRTVICKPAKFKAHQASLEWLKKARASRSHSRYSKQIRRLKTQRFPSCQMTWKLREINPRPMLLEVMMMISK
eukprot:Blabericola_migrator_1__1838@NODE_14_length_24048_cov_80_277428_g11_i0_p18_GENE_NODE_14_length_24048_cov_80_277428_g11_i0NODE_14_length_24048_cov_80_277428_g11_i0_p18_ORF_typecomplete_len107_score12_48DUF4224/PF13986_6/6_2e03DUF4224/PF13986_6/0_38_NODE_14_length_24048_cov_80_277428_g11_i01751417834